MKNFLKSLFGGGGDGEASEAGAAPPAEAAPASPPQENAVSEAAAASELPVGAIVDDLVTHIRSTMPDPRPVEEIDLEVHMFDAGYVTSISAADLLAHIQSTYGLDISETRLIGPLQNIRALADYIKNPS